MSLRSRVPELIGQLLERGVTLTFKLDNEGLTPVEDPSCVVSFRYDTAKRVRSGSFSILYDYGVYGANTINFERNLDVLLDEVMEMQYEDRP